MRFLTALPLLLALATPVSAPVSAMVSAPPVETTTSPRSEVADALDVLHIWDSRRARAWAEMDSGALRSLYVHGSEAGRADVRLLRDYAARGLVVRRLVTQVFAVGVLHRNSTTVRLRVFDRVAGGEVVHDGHTVALRSSRPVTRTVTLRRVAGSWHVAGVSGSVRGPRGAQR
jgi:hypothetical protein